MKKIIAITVLLLFAFPAASQQPQEQLDTKLVICRQIESQRTGEVIELAAEVQKLGKQLQEARAELAKAKTPPPAKP